MMKDDVRQWLGEQFAGEDETMALVWGEYLTETSNKLEATRLALAEENFPELDRLAHTLKGNALMVGDGALVAAAVALRDASKASDALGCEKALARLAVLDGENHAE